MVFFFLVFERACGLKNLYTCIYWIEWLNLNFNSEKRKNDLKWVLNFFCLYGEQGFLYIYYCHGPASLVLVLTSCLLWEPNPIPWQWYPGWQLSYSCPNWTRYRLYTEFALSAIFTAHCQVNVKQSFPFWVGDGVICISVPWQNDFDSYVVQGGYIPKHEGKSKVLHSDSNFLLFGLCCDCIFIDLNWCLIFLFFLAPPATHPPFYPCFFISI